jgi:hypothetical protein
MNENKSSHVVNSFSYNKKHKAAKLGPHLPGGDDPQPGWQRYLHSAINQTATPRRWVRCERVGWLGQTKTIVNQIPHLLIYGRRELRAAHIHRNDLLAWFALLAV